MKRTKLSKTSIKRLKNQSFHKDAVLSNKESKQNANTQESGYKKRIKQKSLSAIFAKKLKEANSVTRNVQQPQVPSQGKGTTAKTAEAGKIERSDATKKNAKSEIRSNSDSTNEPAVSFAKTTEGHVGKILLAKKRDNSKRESKKSLSDIFSNKLKSQDKSDTLNLTQKHNIPKSNFKSDEESKVATKESPVLKSNKIPFTKNSDSTSEPTVSFTKVTKGHIGRVLLAKKKDNSKGEVRKSLSDIFSSQLKNQNTSGTLNLVQKHDVPKDNFKSDKKNKVVTKESPILENTKETDVMNEKKGRKYKKRIENNDRESNKTQKLMHRAGGKMSSLFGNNPDVPTIGQRFVKPILESVFTEITFADLNIHPFTVSMFKCS